MGEEAGLFAAINNCLNRSDGVLGPWVSLAVKNATGSWGPASPPPDAETLVRGLDDRLTVFFLTIEFPYEGPHLVGLRALNRERERRSWIPVFYVGAVGCSLKALLYWRSVSVKPARVLYAEQTGLRTW
jgi:hypothetical protein